MNIPILKVLKPWKCNDAIEKACAITYDVQFYTNLHCFKQCKEFLMDLLNSSEPKQNATKMKCNKYDKSIGYFYEKT